MKQLAAAILFVTYFLVNTGFVVSVHYCMNQMETVEIDARRALECGDCNKVDKEGLKCCKNEVTVFKIFVDQIPAKLVKTGVVLLPAYPLIPNTIFTNYPAGERLVAMTNGPLISRQDTYLRNGVFRI